jgi:integrase
MLTTVRIEMKQRYRVFRRGWGTYYCEDLTTKKQESLRTSDKAEAHRLVAAKNETTAAPAFSRHLARIYWKAGDPAGASRTWDYVMNEIPKLKQGETQRRWLVALKDKAFDGFRNMVILETRPEHLLAVLERGSVSTNVYLRRIHNFALDMDWLPWAIMPKKRWPIIKYQEKRAIRREEHHAIVARESNPERKAFYQLAWHLGAAQSDLAFLEGENIDLENFAISFARKKTGSIALMRFDEAVAEVLRSLPQHGPLFPYLRTVRASDRATEFKQRCQSLGIKGVTLHSYRYAWAERAKEAGYPERFAQEALGHNSKAVHRFYSRKAKVELPSLGEYERQRAEFLEKSQANRPAAAA